jgi:steroid delta-isomerase-like uncharacterized protein
MDELFAADFVDHNPAVLSHDLEGTKQLFSMYLDAFPDVQITVDDLIAEGDRVAARFTGQGTHKGPFMGLPPTGKPFTLTAIDILRIVDGKIVEHWGEADTLGLLQQLGAIPAPGQPGA